MKTPMQNSNLTMLAAAALLLAAPSVRAEDNTGTGGTITYTDSSGANPAAMPYAGGYVVHTFTSSGALTIPVPASADYLVVAGGGGGGMRHGGGGGAGGLLAGSTNLAAQSYTITVGAGGAGANASDENLKAGSPGANSVFGTITAIGGGGGRTYSGSYNGAGGSGGGGSGGGSNPGGGTGISGQGRDGGSGSGGGANGGGGGGAGELGGASSGASGGKGGDGLQSSISGVPTYYAGGGGGGGDTSKTGGAGGSGGGGHGGDNGVNTSQTAGMNGTGGGGGGCRSATVTAPGSAGGSGIVIVRYPYDPGTYSITLTSPANNQSFGSTVSVSATATVFSGTPPHTVKFYLDSNLVSTTNNAPTTVTADLGVLSLGSHTVEATTTDSTSTTVTSATHTFTVETDTTAPTPNPMTFAIAPGPAGADSIVMTATTATDAWTPPVEYSFENTTNSSNSGWISSTVWTDTGLSPVTVYGYRVKARDAAGNETDWSGEAVTMTPGWPTTSLYWDGGTAHIAGNGNGASQGGSGTWDTTIQNWDLGTDYPHVAWYNPNNDTAVFGGTTGTITLGTNITAGGLTFTAAYTLTGGSVTFGAPGTISNAANVTIASVLAGTQPITKSGTGTLTLTASNTFSGDLVINAGAMDNVKVGTFGTGSNITFTGSGTVVPAYGASPVLAKSIAVNDGVTATFNVPNQYYHLTFTGAVTGSGSLSVISSDNGAGSVTLPNSANTFTGTLQVGNADYGTTLTVNSLADSVNPIKMYGNSSRTANFNLGGGTAAPLLFDSRQIELLGSTGASAFISNNNATPTNTIT
ncbi:MAG: autotransporter-associated beta strand repeat-containing protein, partial [Verrucomicrobia bacterium]|nr:autotransporter-associated beta strand repeat-containing protein [Verrucomicrobiota bacterium]